MGWYVVCFLVGAIAGATIASIVIVKYLKGKMAGG